MLLAVLNRESRDGWDVWRFRGSTGQSRTETGLDRVRMRREVILRVTVAIVDTRVTEVAVSVSEGSLPSLACSILLIVETSWSSEVDVSKVST